MPRSRGTRPGSARTCLHSPNRPHVRRSLAALPCHFHVLGPLPLLLGAGFHVLMPRPVAPLAAVPRHQAHAPRALTQVIGAHRDPPATPAERTKVRHGRLFPRDQGRGFGVSAPLCRRNWPLLSMARLWTLPCSSRPNSAAYSPCSLMIRPPS